MASDRDRKQQLDLFGGPPSGRDRVVGPAAVPDDLAEVAAALPKEIHLGTSSWSFPGWDGLVYDRTASKTQLARHGLAAYARHPLLKTVGIDRTYYGPIPASAFAAYAAAVPEHFRFLVKASSESTSPYLREGGGRNELFLDPVYAAEEVVGPFVEGLGTKAGPLVFQFPPVGKKHTGDPEGFAERLGEFLSALPRGPWYGVEIRDRELLVPQYVSALESADAGHVLNVHPRMPPVAEQWKAAGSNPDRPLVVRWMLHSGLGYEEAQRRYEPFSRLVDEDEGARESIADLALTHAARRRVVIIIANNKAEGSAPLTLFALANSIVHGVRP
ncbi:MAG: DUF72 domain-containing protein [Acidobacteriota bacterium]|nr:DUF72 domain-containing protein [Acidobacteriota bacterium]